MSGYSNGMSLVDITSYILEAVHRLSSLPDLFFDIIFQILVYKEYNFWR